MHIISLLHKLHNVHLVPLKCLKEIKRILQTMLGRQSASAFILHNYSVSHKGVLLINYTELK